MLTHYRNLPYLYKLPNYTLSEYITELEPTLIHYELFPILKHY